MQIKYWINKGIYILTKYGLYKFLKKSFRFLLEIILSIQPKEHLIVFKALRDHVKRGIMIDVGAAHGESLRPFAEHGWKVYAFEPDSTNRQGMTKLLGHYPNIEIDPRAVSSETRTNVEFYSSNVSFGIGSLKPFHKSHEMSGHVDVTTLKDYISTRKINRVNFLKVDAEGFDLFILKAFPWDRLEPDIILCEFEDDKTRNLGYSWKELATFLSEKGYHVIVSEWMPITSYGQAHQWNGCQLFPCELSDSNAWGNFIAAKEDRVVNRLMRLFPR